MTTTTTTNRVAAVLAKHNICQMKKFDAMIKMNDYDEYTTVIDEANYIGALPILYPGCLLVDH